MDEKSESYVYLVLVLRGCYYVGTDEKYEENKDGTAANTFGRRKHWKEMSLPPLTPLPPLEVSLYFYLLFKKWHRN